MTQTIARKTSLYERDLDLWLETATFEQRDELKTLLRQSPSLKLHFLKMFDDCFETSLKRIKIEYPDYQFPDKWQFERDIDTMLNVDFWEESK